MSAVPSKPDLSDPLAHRDYGLRSRRQLRFCLAYLGEAQGNASEAARIAGFPCPGQQGYRQLKRVQVRAALARLRDEMAMPPAEVVFWLNEIARADFSDCLSVNKNGDPYIDPVKAKKKGKGHLIARTVVSAYGTSVLPHDKIAAMKLLIGINCMITERQEQEITVNTGARDSIIEKMQRIVEARAAAKALPGPEANGEAV